MNKKLAELWNMDIDEEWLCEYECTLSLLLQLDDSVCSHTICVQNVISIEKGSESIVYY